MVRLRNAVVAVHPMMRHVTMMIWMMVSMRRGLRRRGRHKHDRKH
jgi:hypothetical protein